MRKLLRLQVLPLILTLAGLLCPTRLFGQLTSQGNEQVIPYSGATAFVITNTPVNPNLLVSTGTNTFIMNVNPPANAARVYLTNDTANSCANLTVSVASTGNNSLNSFNAFPNAWQAINVQTGTGGFAATSGAFTLPASGAVAITTQPLIGSKMALFVVLSSGCLTTNIDIQVVFGVFSPTVGAVQGVTPNGANGSGTSPVIIGGLDASNFNRPVKMCPVTSGTGCVGGTSNAMAFSIGANGNTIASAGGNTAVAEPNESGAPLAVYPLFLSPATGLFSGVAPTVSTGAGSGATTGQQVGQMVTDTGYFNRDVAFSVTSSPVLKNQFTPPGNSALVSCYVAIQVTFNSGTSATLDAYFQTSIDGATWTDRIHFIQVLTANSNQFAGIAGGSTGITPVVMTDATLAAATKVDGPIGYYGRMKYIVTGTTPNYTVTDAVACK